MTSLLRLCFIMSILMMSTSALPAGASTAILPENSIRQRAESPSNVASIATYLLRQVSAHLIWTPTAATHSGKRREEKKQRRGNTRLVVRDEAHRDGDRPAQFDRFFPYHIDNGTTPSAPSTNTNTNTNTSTNSTSTFPSKTNTTSSTDPSDSDTAFAGDPDTQTLSSTNANSTNLIPDPVPSLFTTLGPLPVITTILTTVTITPSTAAAESSTTTATEIPSGLRTLPPTTALSTVEPPAPQDPAPASESTATETCPNMTTSTSTSVSDSTTSTTDSTSQPPPTFPVIVTVLPEPAASTD